MIKRFLFSFLLALACSLFSFAQQKEVSGTVSSDDGTPLAGATVTIKGTKVATSTGANGSFKITVPGKSDIIVASFTNYVSKEIAIGNLSTFKIILKPATAELENVVVTVLGFQERADKFGTASSKIGAPEVVRSGETGLLQGMAGKASGVSITMLGRNRNMSTTESGTAFCIASSAEVLITNNGQQS